MPEPSTGPAPSTGPSRHLTRPVIAGFACVIIGISAMILVLTNIIAWLGLALDAWSNSYDNNPARNTRLLHSQGHHVLVIWLVLVIAPATAAVVWIVVARRRRGAIAFAVTAIVLLLPGLAYFGVKAQWSDQPAPQPADTATHCVTYSGTTSTCPGG